MTRSKLSDLEKQEIVSLFEQKQETIPGLAHRYQVSASTIRRLLKQSNLEPIEPLEVIKTTLPDSSEPPASVSTSKPRPITKSARANVGEETRRTTHPESAPLPVAEKLEGLSIESPADLSRGIHPDDVLRPDKDAKLSPRRPSRRREDPEDVVQAANPLESNVSAPILRTDSSFADELALGSGPATDQEELSAIIEEIGHGLEILQGDSSVEDDDDEDDDEDFDDLDEEEDDDDLGNLLLTDRSLQLRPEVLIEVMPLAQADMPKTCYLVIDRMAELVTRPLKDFGELGQIPAHEIQSRTLPVFDNHRIARRFSHRTHRIVKVPNGNMLKATCAQLSAKGITRLLVNGQIYAL